MDQQKQNMLGTGKLSARGRRGARGKVGRGKGIEELKGMSGAGERGHHQNREEGNNEENILLAQSSFEDLTFQISGKVYSVNMNETGDVQCPFCQTNAMQVRKHFKSCVKNKVGTTEEIPELFFKRIESMKKEIKKRKQREKEGNKTIEEKKGRLEQNRNYMKRKRKEETVEEYKKRLEKIKNYRDGKRREKTVKQYEKRLEQMKNYIDRKREEETVEEYEKRLEKMKNYIDRKREEETVEEYEKRLEQMNHYIEGKRGEETLEEKKKILRENNKYKKKKKLEEDTELKKERLKKEAESKKVYRKKIAALAKANQARMYEQTESDKLWKETELTRRKAFQEAVFIGPIYICSCCDRTLFGNSVSIVSEYLKGKVLGINEELTVCFTGCKSADSKVYICSTCKNSLYAGKMPAMAVANGLKTTDLEDEDKLTELENNLIAQNINFQKIILMPKSRWPAGKGRMVSVPVGVQDVMNTITQVPRLPEEAGLIHIKLKRKKQYQGHEKSEFVRPEKLFKVLQILKEMNHPYYQSYDTKEGYEARRRERKKRTDRQEQDKDNIEENLGQILIEDIQNEPNDEVVESGDMDELEQEMAIDEDDIRNDPVRRQHFNYSANSVLVNGHPEIMLNNEGKQVADLNFSPAEGRIPQNFLDQKDWDIKSWPTLHPDGKFGMDYPREQKLTKQKYFNQRILNKNCKFAKTPGYVFGATSYVESERLRNNANISGYRGKKETDEEGQVSYKMKNPFVVFDKIPNTPKYWQNVKFEMLAKMENMGPFQWFFTLSCGDMRWSANFYNYFVKHNYGLEVGDKGHVMQTKPLKKNEICKEGWKQTIKNGKSVQEIEWDIFKDSNKFKHDVSRSEHIRNDVLLATRNFQHRVEVFKKEVMFGNNNPMKVRHTSYRVEFQGRGAGHIHGVMWVDLEEITKDMKVEMDEIAEDEIESTTIRINSKTLLVDTYEKLRKREKLSNPQTKALEKFTDKFCTCTLCPELVGKRAVQIAKQVNTHGHSKSCKKSKPKCRWRYPKFPLHETVFIDKEREWKEEEKLTDEKRNYILKKVKDVLVEENDGKEVMSMRVSEIMKKIPKDYDFKEETNKNKIKQQHKKNIRKRIEIVLEEAGKDDVEKIEYEDYKRAVEQQPEKSCWIYLQRDIDEIFINNYNPEWLEAWDSNIDISLVSDFYGAITYVTDYWTKDSSGMTDVLSTAMKQLNKEDEMKKKCNELANTFISHRQI